MTELSEMRKLGFDDVYVDKYGSIVGRMGDGEKILIAIQRIVERADGTAYGCATIELQWGLLPCIYPDQHWAPPSALPEDRGQRSEDSGD